ncbi:cation:proton antiporter [Haliea sp. E17]|uniref:cation:proton antiporter n=1 Tax=Haliea sp. E17 TaxID=3401576 RepID=UPI003AB0C312
MTTWYLICFLVALAVQIAFLNQFLFKLQTTIAITSGSMLISLALILSINWLDTPLAVELKQLVAGIDFNQFLLKGMLGFLLFAGALEIDLHALRKQKWEIGILATLSTVISTAVVGYLSYWLLGALGWPVPFIYCLLFGALISPTDPIAVLAIIKKMRAPEGVSIQVEGESLFNDGVGLVIFTTIYAVAFSGVEPSVGEVTKLFLVDAIGGIVFGLLLAVIGHYLILHSPDGNIRLMLTLLYPTAGFALANILEISGALAMVASGIFIGNITRQKSAAIEGRAPAVEVVRNFWHALDSVLNALLFLLIGLLLVTFPVTFAEIGLGLLLVPLVLFARFVSVGTPFVLFKRFRRYDINSVRILTWGGLRGGLALAMAAAIPGRTVSVNGVDLHNLILILTYVIVMFSILVQGSTISPMVRKSIKYARRLENQQ